MLNTSQDYLDIRFTAGRILGITVLALGLLLTAVGTVRPAAAASDHAASCITDLARVKRDITVWIGGDHVQYDFADRVQEVERLCKAGQVGEGRNLLAEIKSDVRAVRNERGER